MATNDLEAKQKAHEFKQRTKKDRHELTILRFWNWLPVIIVSLVLITIVVAGLASVKILPWGGAVAPETVVTTLLVAVFGGTLSRLVFPPR